VFDTLVPGRFYPQGLITGLPGVFKGNTTPFRCLEKNPRTVVADLNHPLARFLLTITLKDITWEVQTKAERGGSCMDWIPAALSGPGLQAGFSRWPECFVTPRAFERKDPESDAVFYQADRFVHHMDDQARQILSDWYGALLSPGGKLLDLMAAWTSHLPDDSVFSEVHGLGMNAKELAANSRLTDFSVQDLNQNPVLPFPDHYFDAAVWRFPFPTAGFRKKISGSGRTCMNLSEWAWYCPGSGHPARLSRWTPTPSGDIPGPGTPGISRSSGWQIPCSG